MDWVAGVMFAGGCLYMHHVLKFSWAGVIIERRIGGMMGMGLTHKFLHIGESVSECLYTR